MSKIRPSVGRGACVGIYDRAVGGILADTVHAH